MLRTENRSQQKIVTQITLKLDSPTLNISAGGMSVLSAYPLSEGPPVTLTFNLPGDIEPVICKARVVWCRTSKIDPELYEIGFSFTEISDKDRQRVQDFVKSFLQEKNQ